VTQGVSCCEVSGQEPETRHHEMPTTFGLTLELRHAVSLQRASLRPSRLWVYFPPAVLPLILKPITAVRYYRSVLLICPHPRHYYRSNRGITAVVVTVSSTIICNVLLWDVFQTVHQLGCKTKSSIVRSHSQRCHMAMPILRRTFSLAHDSHTKYMQMKSSA